MGIGRNTVHVEKRKAARPGEGRGKCAEVRSTHVREHSARPMVFRVNVPIKEKKKKEKECGQKCKKLTSSLPFCGLMLCLLRGSQANPRLISGSIWKELPDCLPLETLLQPAATCA